MHDKLLHLDCVESSVHGKHDLARIDPGFLCCLPFCISFSTYGPDDVLCFLEVSHICGHEVFLLDYVFPDRIRPNDGPKSFFFLKKKGETCGTIYVVRVCGKTSPAEGRRGGPAGPAVEARLVIVNAAFGQTTWAQSGGPKRDGGPKGGGPKLSLRTETDDTPMENKGLLVWCVGRGGPGWERSRAGVVQGGSQKTRQGKHGRKKVGWFIS